MKAPRTRRQFLADVGRGALVAAVGYGIARDLDLSPALAEEGPAPLNFGYLEPYVALMQETSVEKLLPLLVERLKKPTIDFGHELRMMTTAAALANARTFGGEDYVGFHTMMAIGPAYHMAMELPEARRPLPVLKVLYRNTSRIQEVGGRKAEVLRAVLPARLPSDRIAGEVLRDAVRSKDVDLAERTFAAIAKGPMAGTLDHLLYAVDDLTEVHRVVLPYRAYDLLDVIGADHAHTLLRQSVRYCVKEEKGHLGASAEVRTLLPDLLESYHLLDRAPGKDLADDASIERTSQAIFEGKPEEAADTAAAALAKGMAPESLGQAITLAANQLLLRDQGRSPRDEKPGKPVGSVHGDSIGVHAGDSASAWRGMARVGSPRNQYACLILGAYQVAFDRVARGGDFLHWQPLPSQDDVALVTAADPDALLRELDGAIRERQQAHAAAVVERYGERNFEPRAILDVLLRYATSEDGALHAEKYYLTAVEEFYGQRRPFRWRALVALARVTASEYGLRAAGYEESCRLLGV